MATRLVGHALDKIAEQLGAGVDDSYLVGLTGSKVQDVPMGAMMSLMDTTVRRPLDQWWLRLREVVTAVSDEPEPQS